MNRKGQKKRVQNRSAKKAELIGSRLGDRGQEKGGKFRTGEPLQKVVAESIDLPDSYGETRVLLQAVDPFLIHASWEVTPSDLKNAEREMGDAFPKSKPILRFYDITYILFQKTPAHSFFDVEVELQARNWYVRLWSPEKSYCANLGLKTLSGRFLSLSRSNIVHTPRVQPSPRREEETPSLRGEGGDRKPLADEKKEAEKQRIEMERDKTAQLSADSGTRFSPLQEKPFLDLSKKNEQEFACGISSGQTRKES